MYNIFLIIGIAGIFIPFTLYPIFIYLLGRRGKIEYNSYTPSIDLIISAFNEEKVIQEKIINSLNLSYPHKKLSIYVISDGSTDHTANIVNQFSENNLKLISIEKQSGKTFGQNLAVKETTSDILVFSDANAIYSRNALHEIVKPFSDEKVGVVCGELKFHHSSLTQQKKDIEAKYWSYEKWLKKQESNFYSTLGANGSIYAVRRKAYPFINPSASSDFIVPLLAVSNGWVSVYRPTAISVENSTGNTQIESTRKRRIIAGSIYSLVQYKRQIFGSSFKLTLMIILHKIMRWMIPFWELSFILGLLLHPIVNIKFLGVLLILMQLYGVMLFFNYMKSSDLFPIRMIGFGFAMIFASCLGIIDVILGRTYQQWTTQR